MSTLLHKCSVICNDYCSVHEMTMLINTKISCIVLAHLHCKCAYKTLLKVLALFKCQHFHTQLYTADIEAPVVQRLDSAIHWINRYPVDKC